MTAPHSRPRQRKDLDAGVLQPEISSFRLCLAAEGKSAKTIRTYCEAVQWFAAAHLRRETGLTSWEQVGKQDIIFAGEACSAHDFSTAHGGFLTGVAAADQVIAARKN